VKFSIKSTDILTENLCFTDYVIVTEEISNLELEIERLSNIINELENILKDLIFGSNNLNHKLTAQIILMRLKELKENNNV